MCGIAGIFSSGRIDPALLRAMAGALRHRGPDDEGVWIDEEAGIGFAHRRLAIVDLSPQGHQPMRSADGRYVLSYNGEIYNHAAIRAELDDHGLAPEGGWRGHSDTETLLQAIVCWGLEAAIGKAAGMFALSLWDRKEGRLHLVRDRFGEKPLYYGWVGRDFVFSSELKALRLLPEFAAEIDRGALQALTARAYIPAPLSIYRGIFKIPPGCMLSLSAAALGHPLDRPPAEDGDGRVRLKRYWSYRQVVEEGLANEIRDDREALEALERVLTDVIKDQSMADVPVGAFLSGGVDSSTVVALYQKHSPTPVRTYSIGFAETGYDEAQYAKVVAAHLGTIHHEHYVTAREARDVIPQLPTIYDEPFADSSQIPTYLVSRYAREEVTVALTGDGGDELFAGYRRHYLAPRMWGHLNRVPAPIRSTAAGALSRIPPGFWTGAANLISKGDRPFLGSKIQKGLRVAQKIKGFEDLYPTFLDEWSMERSPVIGADEEDFRSGLDAPPPAPPAVQMMYRDAVSYLPDDILAKVDRASMAVSLETRAPFLDHRVAAVAARIPVGFKVRGNQGKSILRHLLYRQVPQELLERPKAGFGVPVGEWIRGELRPWAEELLEPRRTAEEGWFDPDIVQRRWQDHVTGRRDSTQALWAILMFQAWLRDQKMTTAMAA